MRQKLIDYNNSVAPGWVVVGEVVVLDTFEQDLDFIISGKNKNCDSAGSLLVKAGQDV